MDEKELLEKIEQIKEQLEAIYDVISLMETDLTNIDISLRNSKDK